MDRLTDILNDIYRLEPDLESEDAAVRALVSELVANKPTVVPDAAFVARLRAELVPNTGMVAHPRAVPSPWYFYAAPAGVFALLLLMLVPQFVTSPTAPTNVPPADDSARVAPESTVSPLFMTAPAEEAADVPMGGGASMKSMGGGASEAAQAEESDMSIMAMPVSDQPVSSFYVPPQRPGAVVAIEGVYATVPALIVIYHGAAVVGVSAPIAPGIMTEVSVALSRPARSGEEFTAVLYADQDGDSIFTPGTDTMLIDPFGNSLTQTFLITDQLW